MSAPEVQPCPVRFACFGNAASDFPQPNVSDRPISLQAAWNINPLAVQIPEQSILMTDSEIDIDSVLPAGFPIPGSPFNPVATLITADQTQDTAGLLGSGTVLPQGTIINPNPAFNRTFTSVDPQPITSGTPLSNILIPGPGELPFSATIPAGTVLTSNFTFSTPLLLSVPVTLPDASTLPVGTSVNSLPQGSLVTANSLILPEGSEFDGPNFGGAGTARTNGTLPPGTTFLPGYMMGSPDFVFPGPHVVGTPLAFDSATFKAGAEFAAGSNVSFTTFLIEPWISSVLLRLTSPSPALLGRAYLSPGSTVAMWSVLAAGVVLPYGNIRPVKLFSARSPCPQGKTQCAQLNPACFQRAASRVVSAFKANNGTCGQPEENLYDTRTVPDVPAANGLGSCPEGLQSEGEIRPCGEQKSECKSEHKSECVSDDESGSDCDSESEDKTELEGECRLKSSVVCSRQTDDRSEDSFSLSSFSTTRASSGSKSDSKSSKDASFTTISLSSAKEDREKSKKKSKGKDKAKSSRVYAASKGCPCGN